MPKPNKKTGEVEYTITQALTLNGDQQDFEGTQLNDTHLEMIEADRTLSKYSLTFKVQFCYSGSFFVQIVYDDPTQEEGENYTKPMYINVEP